MRLSAAATSKSGSALSSSKTKVFIDKKATQRGSLRGFPKFESGEVNHGLFEVFTAGDSHTVAATVDDDGLPVTCAIDIMDADENGLYFLTAKGKGFYHRLKTQGYLALTGMKGRDTLSCVAVSVRGKIRELGGALAPLPASKRIPI